MKLLLTSNGLKGNLGKEAVKLLPKSPQDCKVAFITTAAYGEGDDISWLDSYREELQKVGFTQIEDVDLKDYSEQTLQEKLLGKDVLFVNGGNTFYLLYNAQKSGLKNVLKDFFAKDGLYIGASAGSIICCPTIDVASLHLSDEYPADANTVGLTDMTGLNVVQAVISPHYEENQYELMEEESKKVPLPFYALSDSQALIVKDEDIELVGEGSQVTFNTTK